MKNQKLNLFIIDDDVSIQTGLKNFLESAYGSDLSIFTFNSGRSALKKINRNVSIVILDYNLKGENGNQILKSIKFISPKTEVIMFTSNEEIAVAVESFRKGASDYVIKGEKTAWLKLSAIVYDSITYPIRLLVKEFGVSKYVAIFLSTFILIGVIVFVTLKVGV